MSRSETGVRAAGGWLAVASILLAASLAFHGPLSADLGQQMNAIADGTLRWSIVHWAAAAALAAFAIAALIALAAGSRLTGDWWTMSAWAVVPAGALLTMVTAVAEATVIFDAANSGNRAVFDTWWALAEGMANGFGFMAVSFTVIAGNEARLPNGVTPRWASAVAALAGAAAFAGWVMGSWLGVSIGGLVWVVSSIVMCLWLAWFGASLMRVATGDLRLQGAPSSA